MASIAVIGAGLSGLVTARGLSRQHDVTVFEKSRQVGGRLATRHDGDCAFDHGTQFFTANTPEFQNFLQPMIAKGVVGKWPARFARLIRSKTVATQQWNDEPPHYVGTPAMNSPAIWLAEQLDVRLHVTVASIDRRDNRWLLTSSDGAELGQFDWVVITAPAAQTTALLPDNCSIKRHSQTAQMLGCYTLMLADDRPLALPWDAALVLDANVNWISVNSSKPGRAGKFCLVAHSRSDWADAHIDDDPESVTSHLLDECSVAIGVDARTAAYCRLHRWRYANMDHRDTRVYGIDTGMRLAACGDWFIRGRVEAAFTSAIRLSMELEKHL